LSGGRLMAMLKLWVAFPSRRSVTVAVKLKLPAVVGVPVMEPFAPSDNPAGAEPDHVYGGVPPAAVRVCEYGEPTVPPGKGEVLVMVTG
ncbi:MAG: hypothetical protein ABIZ80_11425, partial [Bryobacteraceae bacterium]